MEAANGTPPTSNVVLVGMMCSGKSSVGRELAKRLDALYVDTDDEVERAAGLTIPEIWESEGESGFRSREALVISALRTQRRCPVVVATGGGILTGEDTSSELKELGKVVYLRARPETLAARAGTEVKARSSMGTATYVSMRERPLIEAMIGAEPGALEKRLAELLSRRSSGYECAADLLVDVDDMNPQEVTGRIIAEMQTQRGG